MPIALCDENPLDDPDFDDFDDDDERAERETCWSCFGEGGYHDCGEDTCCCLDKGNNNVCEECGGTGYC